MVEDPMMELYIQKPTEERPWIKKSCESLDLRQLTSSRCSKLSKIQLCPEDFLKVFSSLLKKSEGIPTKGSQNTFRMSSIRCKRSYILIRSVEGITFKVDMWKVFYP